MRRTVGQFVMGLLVLMASAAVCAQDTTVTAKIVIDHAHHKIRRNFGNENVVVWLNPVDGPAPAITSTEHFRIVQKNKQFYPHVLPIPVGTEVEFPNHDQFFHNVFSLYRGERFDLGLYEAGSSRLVRFERPGVSFIFCNIHSTMSAYVIALPTPYFAVSDARGRVSIAGVPAGRYHLQVWYERADAETLAAITREVSLPATGNSLGRIEVVESENAVADHTDKHGQAYYPEHVPY